jgi:uncharacterized protein (DUF305 family)
MSSLQNAYRNGAMILAWLLFSATAAADTMQHHHAAMSTNPPQPFIASTAKPFATLMDESMGIMDFGMANAPMNGVPDHDFVTMMIPHHQGAVDMAKALLVYGDSPELRNLAQQIITDQQNEINIMKAWLQRYRAGEPSKP